MPEMHNLKGTVRRHSNPGALMLLVLSLIVFGPRVWDGIRGEPWISNELSLFQTSTGEFLVEDIIKTNNPVYGDRQITIEAADGTTLCSSRWAGAWNATSRRNWSIPALAGGCSAPNEPFLICSSFSVYSNSGRHRLYSSFCSPLTVSPNLNTGPNLEG